MNRATWSEHSLTVKECHNVT